MNQERKACGQQRLAKLFALTLAFSVICGSYLPSYSQSSPLSPREALEERIRADVAQRLDIYSAPPEYAEIKELYLEEAQAAGLTYPELINLYAEEYAAQQAAKKPGLVDPFLPNPGWLVALFSTAVLAYVTLLKNWIEARVKAIAAWFYQKFSGTRLYRNVALRKYRAALVENYQHLPMPFLKNRDPLKMSEVYVPLKVSDIRPGEHPGSGDIGTKHESTDALNAIADQRRLMVIGEPGSGKSVLLKYLAWAYGLGKLDALPDRPTVVLLELYRLSDGDLNKDKLMQALVDTFDRNQLPNAQDLVGQGLDSGTLMLLLDGLDEVNSAVRPHVVSVIRDLLTKCRQCRVVITCRTAIYDDEFSDIVDRKLEVVEFTDQQMRRFLRAWEPEMQQARKSINQMMAALRERPLILKLARNPLLLTLMAYLYTEPAFVLPRSRAEFYDKSTGILLEQREYKGDDYNKHNRYEPNEKRRVLQHLALCTQDYSADLQDRRSLKAEVVREQVRQVLPSLDISEKKAKDILDEIAERSGLLMKIDGGERYLFPHLTIQEYFAAAALNDRETDLVSRFAADPAAWREVVKLWCSLANESSSLVEAVYRQDPITGLECLAEARQVDQTLANQIIEHFKLGLDQPQTDDTLARAFGAVAANDRERGQAVFTFLKDTLLDPQASELRRAFAAEALSRTNLPKAATVLIDWYKDSRPIVQMGDLAVPGLAELAQNGILQALDDLYAIATPDAANALVPLLWHEQQTVMGRAAWCLGGLLPQPDIEETLKDYSLTHQQQQTENLDWIWQPFNGAGTSALPIIAGRVAYLLQCSSLQLIPGVPPNLDPRLVVPLCTFQLKPNLSPAQLPATVEALLEQTEQTPQLQQACLRETQQLLAKQPQVDQQWQQLVATLPPMVELDLLSRLIAQSQPNPKHWERLFRPVDYDFRTSWHYSGNLLVAAILTVIAVLKIIMVAFAKPEILIFTGSLGIAATAFIASFWMALYQNSLNTLDPDVDPDPDVFSQLGFWGILTHLHHFFSNSPKESTRKSVIAMLSAVFQNYFYILVFVSIFGLFVGTLAFSVHANDAVQGAFVGAATNGALFMIGSLMVQTSLLRISSERWDLDFLCVFPANLIFLFILFFMLLFFPGAFIFTLAGMAVGASIQLEYTPEKRWLKILSLFAFPWFCWLPIVSILATWALYDLLGQVSPVNSIPVWRQTALGVAIVAGAWAALWHRGQWLEARARNPFHGGALGAALGVKRL